MSYNSQQQQYDNAEEPTDDRERAMIKFLDRHQALCITLLFFIMAIAPGLIELI